jgi:hypothetical protein
MNCLSPINRWGRGYESDECLCPFSACVVLCVGKALRRSDPRVLVQNQETENAATVQQ